MKKPFDREVIARLMRTDEDARNLLRFTLPNVSGIHVDARCDLAIRVIQLARQGESDSSRFPRQIGTLLHSTPGGLDAVCTRLHCLGVPQELWPDAEEIFGQSRMAKRRPMRMSL